jgi:hypothetical protein
MAFAGESVLQSGVRLAEQAGRAEMTPSVPHSQGQGSALGNRLIPVRVEAAQGQEQGLEKSGMGKGRKILIWTLAGAGIAAAAYTIDHNVFNITPSTLGTRKD